MCFVLLPPAAACLLYKWLLAPMAFTVAVLLSHYLIRGHIGRVWHTSSYRALVETLFVAVAASITALFANQLSGVRRVYLLLPLVLLPVPLLLHRIGLISTARADSIALEYYLYTATLLLLLFAIHESFIEFLVQTRAILARQHDPMFVAVHPTWRTPKTPVSLLNEQRLWRAADKTILAAAIFTLFLLLVNLVLVSLWPQVTPVNSMVTALENTANASVPNDARYSLHVEVDYSTETRSASEYSTETTAAATVHTNIPVTPQLVQLVADTRGNYSQNSTVTRTDEWPFVRSFFFSVALLFESPVTLFAAASSLAVPLYALLVALDTSHKRLSPVPEFHFWSFVQHMRHVCRVDVGVSDSSTTVAYVLLALVFYGFTNRSLSALEPALERLLYLHVWIVTCAVRLLSSALGFYLQTMPYESGRKRSILFNVALHVLLLAPSCFFIWYCWPLGSMPFWQYFWAVVIVLNAATSVIYSLLRVSSALCAVYLHRTLFRETEWILLGIKLLWMLVLIVFSLWLFALASANEWNALTLVAFIGFVTSQGFSACRNAGGLSIACRQVAHSARPPITEDSDPVIFREVRSMRAKCCLCRCSVREEQQLEEQEIERSVCEEPHYFHAACFRMWRIDHSICPICRDPQQPSSARLIEYIAAAVHLLSNVERTTQRAQQLPSIHVQSAEVAPQPDAAISDEVVAETRAEARSHDTLHTDNL